jgi:hypothetical protein
MPGGAGKNEYGPRNASWTYLNQHVKEAGQIEHGQFINPNEHAPYQDPIAAEQPHEQELLGTASEYQKYSIEMGTVGWEDDQGPHYSLDTSPTDGTTLLKVQLYRGKMAGKAVKAGVAQGHKVLAQLSGPLWHVPDPGQRVLVAFPSGMEDIPGAAVVVAMPGPAPSIQYTQTKSKLDVGPDHDLVIKGRSLTFSDYSNRFVSITPAGIVIQDTDGSGIIVQSGVINIFSTNTTIVRLDGSSIQIVNNGQGGLTIDSSGNATLTGKNASVLGGTVYLGNPTRMTPTNFAIYGLSGPVGLASTSVIVAT